MMEGTRDRLKEVIALLKESDAESDAVARLVEAQERLDRGLREEHESAARAIRALSSRVAAEVEDASRAEEVRDAKAELEELERERSELDAAVGSLRGDKAVAEADLRRVEAAVKAVEGRLEAARAREDGELPRLRHVLGLFVNICSIKWDEKAPEGVLRGLVAPPPGKGVPGAFEVDVGSMGGATAVADALWARVDACHA